MSHRDSSEFPENSNAILMGFFWSRATFFKQDAVFKVLLGWILTLAPNVLHVKPWKKHPSEFAKALDNIGYFTDLHGQSSKRPPCRCDIFGAIATFGRACAWVVIHGLGKETGRTIITHSFQGDVHVCFGQIFQTSRCLHLKWPKPHGGWTCHHDGMHRWEKTSCCNLWRDAPCAKGVRQNVFDGWSIQH